MAFFCFRKKLPWSKASHYNCNDGKERNGRKTNITGAADEDFGPYECTEPKDPRALSPPFEGRNRLDKYGIDINLDGSLRRSKKKKKKLQILKPKPHEKQTKSPEKKDEKSRLAFILDNATADSPVQIITSMVDDYGPTTQGNQFQVKVGDKVIALYRQGAFVFVRRFDGVSGFVPVQVCFLIGEYITHGGEIGGSADKLFTCEPPVVPDGSVSNSNDCLECQDEQREPFKDITDSDLHLGSDSPKNALAVASPSEGNAGLNDYECDSLARKVKKHEIRQLLKQETRSKMVQSTDEGSKGNVGLGSQTSLQKTNHPPTELENKENKDGCFKASNEKEDVHALSNGSMAPNLSQQYPISSSLNGGSPSSRNNSKLSLNESYGSQRSLNSLKSKGIRTNLPPDAMKMHHSGLGPNSLHQNGIRPNGLHQNGFNQNGLHQNGFNQNGLHQNGFYQNGYLSNRMHTHNFFHTGVLENDNQRTLKARAHFDSQSLSSYDGSVQDIFAKRNEISSRFGQNRPAQGHFAKNENSLDPIEARIHELLLENQFIRNRRCSSLRKVGQHGGYSGNHSSGHGHGHGYSPGLAADERSWRMYAESLSAPGSRVMSPSEFEYQFSPTFDGSFEGRSGDRFMFALQDFRSMGKDDINLRKGERVVVLRNDSDSWWWVRNSNGDEGFVPSHFLIPLLKPAKLDFGSSSDFSTKSSISSHGEQRPSINSDTLVNKDTHSVKSAGYRDPVSLQGSQPSTRLVRANTFGSESRGKYGVKVDWTKMYNTGNGSAGLSKLKDLNGLKNGSDVDSKEALLRKIRSEVERDPMSSLATKGRVRSKENIHRVGVKSIEISKSFHVGNQKRVAENGPVLNGKAPADANHSKEPKPGSVEPADADRKFKKRPDLPSYDQCVDQIRREDHTERQYSGSSGDISLESGLYSTPRVLRRRRTYSGTLNNKKVRFNQQADDQSNENGHEDERELKDNVGEGVVQNGAKPFKDEVDSGLSTWC